MTIIGTVDIRDFDLGCYLTLGAYVIYFSIDGSSRAQYVVSVDGINNNSSRYGSSIPVFFDSPEDPYQDYILPSFVFKQNSMDDAFDRQPYAGTVARAPSKDALPVYDSSGEIAGYTKYDEQVRPDPYNISYDLEVKARRQQELNMMMRHVRKVMRPPWFVFKVVDSLDDVREYDAGELSYSNSSELADIADRMMSMTVSFTVRGEIDTFDDISSSSMVDPRYSLNSMEG